MSLFDKLLDAPLKAVDTLIDAPVKIVDTALDVVEKPTETVEKAVNSIMPNNKNK